MKIAVPFPFLASGPSDMQFENVLFHLRTYGQVFIGFQLMSDA
jgi:hypothetical protein